MNNRVIWTEESIREKLLEVVNALELDRMPSKSEVEQYYQNYCLSNAISKHGGWKRAAESIGLPIKNSETYFGKRHEAIVAEMLASRGFEAERMPTKFPYDLLVDGCAKVDVKASMLYRGENGNFYTYNTEKPYSTCDFYILLEVGDDKVIQRTMIVPSAFVVRNRQISVGEKSSKYHAYTDRYDLISQAIDFWNDMRKSV